jgi:cytoskeletal protein CcmA (bactofilin family)
MNNFNMEGIGKINGGDFDTVTVEGVGTCTNNLKAESIRIEGVFNCSGEVEAGLLYCKGVGDFKGNIRSKKMVVEGVLTVKDDNKIEAEEITCEGVIKTGGEISADIINAEGCIVANEIVGDQIKIITRYRANRFFNFFNKDKSDVRLIEATTIELRDVTAETVNGRDITIGPFCKIDNIDCSGTLSIDRSAIVKNISGNYTRRD